MGQHHPDAPDLTELCKRGLMGAMRYLPPERLMDKPLFCADCRHCDTVPSDDMSDAKCRALAARVDPPIYDLVSGIVVLDRQFCSTMRAPGKPCGVPGRLFESRHA